ncbi:hypothetical protein AB0F46_42645 [Streptomyces sp. NPDC026665]|uniref:hypothetical protein n=1 Tax=Streptomyces sp. NPDC026665 TaxID=3154798 RepID=UPI0033C37D53
MTDALPISVATRAAVHTWSSTQPYAAGPCSRYTASFSRQRGHRRHRDPLGPREARACAPPSRHNWCHWQADFTLTRSHRATSGG